MSAPEAETSATAHSDSMPLGGRTDPPRGSVGGAGPGGGTRNQAVLAWQDLREKERPVASRTRTPGAFAGVAPIATTPPVRRGSVRLAFPVVKILGSRDCVAPADDARANAARLPPHTRWIEIAGGNHAQSDITDRRSATAPPTSIARCNKRRRAMR
jgi:pimeloyl-ACP methyl ester carboxylesterase